MDERAGPASRRTVLLTLASVAVVGSTGLAGCIGGGSGSGGGGGSAGRQSGRGGRMGDHGDTHGPRHGGGPSTGGNEASTAASYDGWLDGANNVAGVVDRTGRSEVEIAVGAAGGYAFAPAAVRVSPGTTVTWRWTGVGGAHNVVHVEEAFRSEFSTEQGYTFSHRFDDPGVYTYVCEPHQMQGMKGVVDVVDE